MALRSSRRRDAAADEALIRSLYDEHGRALLAYATRLTNDRAAAEDVVQETLLRAWRNPEVLTNQKGSVRGWLLTVTRNIVTDRFRARAARPTEVADTTETAQPPAQRDHAEEVVDSIVVLDALDRLSPEHRDVVTALYFHGQSVSEAAQSMGVPPGTVKSRTYYALRRMRETIAGQPAGMSRSGLAEGVTG